MFDPIKASREIKDSYIDYITTTFDMDDAEYRKQFRQELEKDGMVARGPFLDIGGSFETGKTMEELIQTGSVSPLFRSLEPVTEKERELKLERPLYSHQEKAIQKAATGENLVVTTGTGSGKTESFLIPIINHLLRELEVGTLSPGVRAIIIYPMNALANDQMKRMRALLKNYPQICYGVYNGNTPHKQSMAKSEYRRTYHDEAGELLEPAPNEIISREVMQDTPPHILITNYSMLEYMMLRPKDDKVFSGAKLKFIVLDEAHIYKGATGMETSLLMRRLRARISQPDSVQYILTSATLGGPESDGDILNFAEKLCGVSFQQSGIIRSKEKPIEMAEMQDFPLDLFDALHQTPNNTDQILAEYHADFAPGGDAGEKLYALMLHAKLFATLRRAAKEPITVKQLRSELSAVQPMTDEQVLAFIDVCARAERDGASLIKPRYHFFVRALEGAYITLTQPKRIFLQRRNILPDPDNGRDVSVFEAAVCTDCGRLAIVGREEGGFLRQYARQGLEDKSDYYYLKADTDVDFLNEEEDDLADDGMNDFVICPICAAIGTEADSKYKPICDHTPAQYRKLRKVLRMSEAARRRCPCPACGAGSLRRFFLGSEAATAVLGTELFEQLPDEEVIVQNTAQNKSTRRNIFATAPKQRTIRKKLTRQFLCFSDSRSEAAFFASYMERSYEEFLRRRGIWHVAEKFRDEGVEIVDMYRFVDALTRYFDSHRSFVHWDDDEGKGTDHSFVESQRNAWIAILNEMFNARRATSLVSMGVISFEYQENERVADVFAKALSLPPQDARDLLESLTQEAVFAGAIDAGTKYKLTDEEREYIFFAPTARRLVLRKEGEDTKNSSLAGWCGKKRSNGSYYPNNRMARLTRAAKLSPEDADGILEDYWDEVFEPETEEFVLDANDFDIRIGGTPSAKFYRCKKCGRVTPFNVKGLCSSVKCTGTLEPCNPMEDAANNHYAKLYRSTQSSPLFIKEHTAQLAKEQQTQYQEAFVQKKINALSCSTTFEMGVDVGSLETVYMRDVPPSPANYVQRAGRAGRGKHSAAFVLTYAKLSSHDFTYYENPTSMISGKIQAPVFEIENEKILYRHIFAVALSEFLYNHSEVYDGDNQTVLLNEGGYELLKTFLDSKPEKLHHLLLRSIPVSMHQRLGIDNFGWVEKLCGEDGVLEIAVADFRSTVAEMEKAIRDCRRKHDDEGAGTWSRTLRNFRCGKDDNAGKKSLISFLVRNNVLPKYGFPVDTVELFTDLGAFRRGKSLQLARDLQVAIADYAPGSQVVADGRMYTSRYIRKLPGRGKDAAWEKGFYCQECPTCGKPNFTKEPITGTGRECVSCHTMIPRRRWMRTLEPRMGFFAEKGDLPVPMHRPEHDFKTEDCYIGDPHRNLISKQTFQIADQVVEIESTSNDSLAVIGQTRFQVCPVCGYAKDIIPSTGHKNARGYPCTSNAAGKWPEYLLSHDFKTDVAKITFHTQAASDLNTMRSVLYALLEGLSQEMGIERTDIKGCLFYTSVDGAMVFSVVLYDAVAGGAGHVRRIVTEDGRAFQKVLAKALSIMDHCDCDSSCYKCLRNYYNQKIHDDLDRKKAATFLREWIGPMELVPDRNTEESLQE